MAQPNLNTSPKKNQEAILTTEALAVNSARLAAAARAWAKEQGDFERVVEARLNTILVWEESPQKSIPPVREELGVNVRRVDAVGHVTEIAQALGDDLEAKKAIADALELIMKLKNWIN